MTLFDITKTNINNRRHFSSDNTNNKERNQQSNLETLLQVISLRSQPENVSDPIVIETKKKYWGSTYKSDTYKTWCFTFTVNYKSIFTKDDDELGILKSDCEDVPMIIDLDENVKLISKLSNSKEYKNIHFEVQNDTDF